MSRLPRYKICDPIHGFIRFDEVEKQIVDSPFFQRMRYIRQMGVAYLLYPGATHTRFEHSLGVMELSTRIFETLSCHYPMEEEEERYFRQIVRYAALCHDMGHLPFSHTAEVSLLPQEGHEGMTKKIIENSSIASHLEKIDSIGRDPVEDVVKVSMGEKLPLDAWQKILSQIITDDHFGADRIDYLLRDAHYSGVSYGYLDYEQLIDSLRILPSLSGTEKVIGLTKSGIQSVESLWISRYFMLARVTHHSMARLYTNHMRRFMERHYEKVGFPSTLEGYLKENDAVILIALEKAADEGDYDAKTILKRESGYVDVTPSHPIDSEEKLIDALREKFGEEIFIDYFPDPVMKGFFPVLTDEGKVISSDEASKFLHDIPIRSRHLFIFAHPEKAQEVLDFASSF